jgi:hypothetical protein
MNGMTRAAFLLVGVGMTASVNAWQASRPATWVTLPAGTVVNVRLTQDIDVDVAQVGMTFRVRVDDPVSLDGRIVIPREAVAVAQAVKVAQSGAFKGSDHISLKLNSISVGGVGYQVATEYAVAEGKGEGKRTARKVGGGAGLGAIVGGIAGGGEGALVGTLVGGIAGTAVAASGEEHLRLPAETRLQFKLAASVRIEM